MESANTQLDLLKDRIEYDPLIFGEGVKYYEYSNIFEGNIYTLSSEPKLNEMTYIYVDEEMIEYKTIDAINLSTGAIIIGEIEYDYSNETIVYETYIKVLKRLLEDSKYVALSLKFPYKDYSTLELPNKYKNWQLRCCEEIYQGIGTQGIKSYSENGLSWTRDSGYISYELRGEIEPQVGYIKEVDEDEEI